MKKIETISIKCETKETLNIAEMKVFQGALKERTDVDYDKIKLSIIKYGFSFPFFLWKDRSGNNWLIDGTGRHETLCKMQKDGYVIPDLPVVFIQCKDRKEAKQKLLRLNSQYGKMTKESVLEFAEDIELNFDEIALPDSVIDFTDAEEPQETEGDDEAPEVDEKSEPVSKRGEMYELGSSILMCGDSTSAEDVARLMGGAKADLVFTDPPYNVAMSRSLVSGKDNSIQNDNLSDEDFEELLSKAMQNAIDFNKTKNMFVWIGFRNYSRLENILKNKGVEIANCIVWAKNSIGLGGKGFRYQHELGIFTGETNNKTSSDLWQFDRCKEGLHPTMKPVELVEFGIKNCDNANMVLDLFGGSGSTLIACEKNNRKARLMELDPKYCDVIRRRYTKWAKENNRPITSGCLE